MVDTKNQTPILQAIGVDGTVVNEIQPDVVSAFDGTKPFNSDSTQLQDGQTVVDENGDTNLRVNMEMQLTHSEFIKLDELERDAVTLRVVAPAYTGKATFDQLKFKRIPDSNGRVTSSGSDDEALYMVQLQSKEQSNKDESLFQPFSNGG